MKQDTIAIFIQIYFDIILKSIGNAGESLTAFTFGQTNAISELSTSCTSFQTDSPLEAMVHQALDIRVHALFNDFDKAVELALKQGETLLKAQPGIPLIMMSTFYSSFSLIAKAALPSCAKAEKRKLLRLAKKKHRIIKKFVKANNPNVIHFDYCLDAELAAITGHLDHAERSYQKAVTIAARAGFIQEAGLASERYALLLRNHFDNSSREIDAIFHFNRAIEFYTSWGSPKKVEQLEKLKLRATSR